MKRFTRREVGKDDDKEYALCEHEESDCNDSCKYGTCEWNQMALLRLKTYEDMHEKIINRMEKIKLSSNYPHDFMGQMVEDYEWVLEQLI